MKIKLLGVPAEMLAEHSAVSEPVAKAMAEGARAGTGSDYALSITGYAGPDGEKVGLVFIGLASPDGTEVRRVQWPADRERVRAFSTNIALDMLRRKLLALRREAPMPFQVLRSASQQHSERDHGLHRGSRIHAFADARAQLHVRLHYCYVPTMRIYGGLKPDDWRHWGQFTTFKSNAPELLRRQLRTDQVIYCSPLVDPYQPAEETEAVDAANSGRIARAAAEGVRDSDSRSADCARSAQADRTCPGGPRLRVSFSLTTNREASPQAVRAALRDHRLPAEGDSGVAQRGHHDLRHARAAAAVRS